MTHVLAQRLLTVASGAGNFAAAASEIPFTLTAAPHGGWTQIQEPKAIEYNGALYFGVVNGSNGNIELYQYVIATASLTGPTVMHAALAIDTHAAPAVQIRSDGRIICAYSGHDDVTHLYVWISTKPEDISAGTETNIDASFGSDHYTYCSLFRLSAEGKLYLFVRSRSTANYLQMSTSTDDGATWAAHTDLYVQASNFSYWKICTNGVDRIDFVVSSDSGAPVGLGSLYHWYWNGAWRKTDGTAMGSPTFHLADLTLAYDGSSNPAWATDIIFDGSVPRIVAMTSLSSNTDGAWIYLYWTGSTWVAVTVVASIGFGVVDPSPVAALDVVRTSRLYAVRYIAGHHQLWRYRSGDAGATWNAGELVETDARYPAAVKGHAITHPAILYLVGSYTADVNNSQGVHAIAA